MINEYNEVFRKSKLNTIEIINLASSKWNFYKVLLDKNGHFHSSFNSLTKPNSPRILKVVDEILKQP